MKEETNPPPGENREKNLRKLTWYQVWSLQQEDSCGEKCGKNWRLSFFHQDRTQEVCCPRTSQSRRDHGPEFLIQPRSWGQKCDPGWQGHRQLQPILPPRGGGQSHGVLVEEAQPPPVRLSSSLRRKILPHSVRLDSRSMNRKNNTGSPRGWLGTRMDSLPGSGIGSRSLSQGEGREKMKKGEGEKMGEWERKMKEWERKVVS